MYSTAVAVTALAPYYETSGAYTITQNQTGYVIDLSPKDAVEDALNYLSAEQDKDGDWGDLESTAMTVIALIRWVLMLTVTADLLLKTAVR